jgi:hypothetical protein
VDSLVEINVSEEHTASIFRVEEWKTAEKEMEKPEQVTT